ncbi:MAG: hypothetical protein J5962_06100 [Lachnospiraceae bacterium]|nr:hypothetical protein [Lachnospiraceae bacterium]
MYKTTNTFRKVVFISFLLSAGTLYGCSDSSADTYEEEPTAIISEDTYNMASESDSTDTTSESDPTYTVSGPDLSDASPGPDLSNLIDTALEPLGSTMYVWGGGWNEEDTGAGIEAITMGLSPRWAQFTALQDSTYDFTKTKYQIHDGLDCSGYIGWMLYNIFPNGDTGYVMKSGDMAITLSSYGWGSYTPVQYVTDWKTGDIMSMQGHVWMVLTECDDGSVLLIHSSPPGVRICGTAPPGISTECLVDPNRPLSSAEQLATQIMSENYPDWYRRYPDCSVSCDYLTSASQFRWGSDTLTDTLGIRDMDDKTFVDYLLKKDADH